MYLLVVLNSIYFFIFPKRFIYLFEREKETERQRKREGSSLCWFASQVTTWPGLSHVEPELRSFVGVSDVGERDPALRLYPSTLLAPFSGSWSRSAELRHEPMAAALQTMPQCWPQDSLLLKLSVIVG